jgi:cytochrome c peroxidase
MKTTTLHAAPAALARQFTALALTVVLLGTAATVQAQPSAAELFRDADLALGAKLIAEHGCAACHVAKRGGDGSAIYRPQGRINTPGFLRGMVEQCNTELNLGLFPEEVSAIAAVLNRDHYKFK